MVASRTTKHSDPLSALPLPGSDVGHAVVVVRLTRSSSCLRATRLLASQAQGALGRLLGHIIPEPVVDDAKRVAVRSPKNAGVFYGPLGRSVNP